ncbi:MAG TPA: hypothetical protein VGA20_11655 [Gemmatimonadales bacterium]
MGKINLKGVVVGGLLAGLVLNVVDYLLYGVILADDMNAAMQALGKGPIGGSAIAWFVVIDFLYGIALVWGYAAMRPRFGAGPGTAARAGLYVWAVAMFFRALSDSQMGVMPMRLVVIGTISALVLYPVAAVVGAWPYKEEMGM